MKTYWVGYAVRRFTAPEELEELCESWPAGVKGWITGEDFNDRVTWCARVEAESEEDAKIKVLEMYGRLAPEVHWRFGPDEKPAGWWPPEDRCPR